MNVNQNYTRRQTQLEHSINIQRVHVHMWHVTHIVINIGTEINLCWKSFQNQDALAEDEKLMKTSPEDV